MARAFVFPGQGSQAVGMGKPLADAFPVAREVFEEVDEALGRRLSKIDVGRSDGRVDPDGEYATSTDGPFDCGDARSRKRDWGECSERPLSSPGTRLGEYSALCAAGAISLSDTAKLY